MENWDSHLRPLIAVLSQVSAANPGVGTNISLYEVDGFERPILVVFGKPWVVWLYIDSGNFMLRGGFASERLVQPPRPAAVAVGRVGTSESDVPAKITGMVRQLAAEVPEEPADKYTWIGAGGYVAQLEGKYAPLTGHYQNVVSPLINRFPLSEGPGGFGASASPVATAPPLHRLPASSLRLNPAILPQTNPPMNPAPADADEVDRGPDDSPALRRPGLIPGCAGAAALLLAVLPLDYSFYGLIRWVVFVSAIWLVSVAANRKEYGWMCGYAVVAVLWNPLLPFGSSRANWLMPDLIGAGMMAFGAYAFVSRRREASER